VAAATVVTGRRELDLLGPCVLSSSCGLARAAMSVATPMPIMDLTVSAADLQKVFDAYNK